MFRRTSAALEVFLVHPGGPFWAKKDLGVWSIPKGEYAEGESTQEAAKREFREETGFEVEGDPFELGRVKQAGGKLVSVWAVEGDCDAEKLVSNTCSIAWPPRSGRSSEIPEVDRGEWFAVEVARERIVKGQAPVLDLLIQRVSAKN